MATIAAADVKKLRDATGAGMMDAKKALVEADGDFDKAIEVLRVSGAAKAAKRGAERSASNGLVAAADGALIKLAAETDFVAKNEEFQNLATAIVTAAAEAKADGVEPAKAVTLEGGRTAADAVTELAAKIGEALELADAAYVDGKSAVYLHRRDPDLPPQIGVLVAYEGDDEEAAKAVARQIAAMRPNFLTRDEVPAEEVERERRIAEERAREEGKPEQAIGKIVEGRVNAFFKEVVLLDQPSVLDQKTTVAKELQAAGVTVTRFVRFEAGA
ncbi:translation elongation factor Ts [Microlunatus sp. Gsoil 973]|jgi:elongation factor Ts|uniref:translation elongation factor Ts n=1 Tax=Microlunatus sp. Gsoil 973 TaxID=2672569 RepID=UPI0012B4AF5D|nr:translation elongation factor Ts [Microlunatus sp. Gsoil 973]QGN32018.1 elongation factor Ts [Microlunatus sp. Gsoil 973]